MTEPTSESNSITYFAEANYRGKHTRFGIWQADRMGHVHIMGKTGTGKSTLLETLIRQDIDSGQGIALLDPHGDLVEKIENLVPAHRRDDLIYFNVTDPTNSLGFNPLDRLVAPPWVRYFLWFQILLGWALGTLFVAGMIDDQAVAGLHFA